MKSSSLLRPGRRLAYGVALSAVFAVAGCAMAPTTVRPVAPVAAAYPSQADQAAAPAAVAAAGPNRRRQAVALDWSDALSHDT